MNLSRWLAENLFDYKIKKTGGRVFKEALYGQDDHRVMTTDEWHPETDISQAFEVVGKMQEKGFGYHIGALSNSQKHRATFIKGKYWWECYDENLITAICLAAKKAIAAQEGG